MSDDQILKLSIHYGGTMKKDDDGYNYICELGCKSICWKFSEIRWLKFEEFIRSVDVLKPISLIWFKEACEETKMMKYVFDKTSDDIVELRFFAEAAGEIDVYIEHDCSKHLIGEANAESCKWEIDDGYEPDEDEIRAEEGSEYGDDNSDEGDMPPKEDDEPEESEDETPAGDGDDLEQEAENQNESEGLNINQTKLDDGDEVVIDAGDGGDDARFRSVFVEGSMRNADLDETTRKLAEEQAVERKEDEIETDPEFGLEDSKYPDTPLESEEEWEQWKNPKREKKKDKFNRESHCADVNNNLSEAFNRTIKIARSKPVITMLEDIRRQAMARISRRWAKSDKCNSFLTPITMAILEKARISKKYCNTLRSSTYIYEVNEFNVGYTVDLARHQCACRRWDLTDDNQNDPEKYVANYYETSCLKNTYLENIKPVNGEQFCIKTGRPPIAIPNIRKPRGRPKKRDRKKEPFESLKNPGKSTRHGRIPHCSRCGEAGHIKSGCKNEPVVVEGPKNKRGRPPKPPSEFPPMRQPRTRKSRANPNGGSQPLPTNETSNTQNGASSSQPLHWNHSTSELFASSNAPHRLVSSSKPKPKKGGRPLKVRKVENIPRGVGTFWSPFTGRPFTKATVKV